MCNISKCKYFWFGYRKPLHISNDKEIDRETVIAAGNELRHAYQIFSQAEEEDMVDYAVFTVKAAEKRYGYLLKKLKEQEKRESWQAKGGTI